MRYRKLIVLFVSMLIGLPAVAGDWPAGERERFVEDCVNGAQAEVPADTLRRYCACAADKVGSESSTVELEAMKAQKAPLPQATHQRVMRAAQSCLSQLNN
ncbi:hypothetical protein [Metapseudomonas boanensis]|uniref:Secreted protein n=1 Tax=Metapseudomonas boanensis TaxID=2822138 RepID=A0ABS5XQC4_9GAMM|nr:hypothetical protein [Pseudomonas boanensis]MBT8769311.1 hypothetical protein [Pseudomonas boanensis]